MKIWKIKGIQKGRTIGIHSNAFATKKEAKFVLSNYKKGKHYKPVKGLRFIVSS